ncbi:unnamed protein product, partial [Meganyctiphanes norvegica]
CDMTFSREVNILKHIRTHALEKPNQCRQFEINSSHSDDIINLQRRHNTGGKCKCSHCEKTFAVNGNLSIHTRKHTEIKHQHNLRDNSFSQKNAPKYNLRIHTMEKLYMCSHCDKTFLKRNHLVRHLSRVGEKPYQCSICENFFSTKSSISIHMMTHTGEKPYQCKMCDEAFPRNIDLIYHLKLHTGEKSYKCSQCDKKFYKKYNLACHLITHNAKKQYQCSHCDKA